MLVELNHRPGTFLDVQLNLANLKLPLALCLVYLDPIGQFDPGCSYLQMFFSKCRYLTTLNVEVLLY